MRPPLQDHLTGKQFLGWKSIRDKHKELVDKMEKLGTSGAGRASREPEEPRSGGRTDRSERERERSPRRCGRWCVCVREVGGGARVQAGRQTR